MRLVVLALLVAGPLAAQQTPPRPPPRPLDSLRARIDTLAPQRATLVTWIEPDSILRELLRRPGFSSIRYQGDTVRLVADSGTIALSGRPAAVSRNDSTLIVGDSIKYSDSTKYIVVYGDPLTIRDPGRNAADILGHGRLIYDLTAARAVADSICTSIVGGDEQFLCGRRVAVVTDSATGVRTVYLQQGYLTTCDLHEHGEIPHYHWRTSSTKVITEKLVVGRSAWLYIYDIPILWIPMIVQDTREGRRSGILTPRLGIAELLRNSTTYRRTVDNLGYYFALSDYMDAQVSLDWRSGARPQEGDPGYVRYNGEWRYRWLSRFLSGRASVSHLRQQDGRTNTAISLGHFQDFSQDSRISLNLNYVTSTEVHRRNEFVPYRQLATIASRANYQNQIGPFSLSLGGSRTQYPGTPQVDQTLPTLSVSTQPIELAPWLVWTPGFVVNNSQRLNVRQTGALAFFYRPGPGGLLDSVAVGRDSRTTTMSFDSPLKIFNWSLTNSFRASDIENDYPEVREIIDVRDTSQRSIRVFSRTFRSEIDWQTGFSLPTLLSGTWNLSPSVSFVNVDPAALWIRTERTGGRFVSQTKRPSFGLSVSPTFFARVAPPVGPFSALRHSITTSLSYGYAPAADVSDEFLAALGRTRPGYLGSLAQNAVSLSITTNVEAKIGRRATAPDSAAVDSATAGISAATAGVTDTERKVNVIAVDFDALTWDFERARATGGTGLTTDRFGFSARSDLLPGLDFATGFSLFEGSTLSDTARFKPYLTDVRASFSLNRDRNPFALLNRVFGRATPQTAPQLEQTTPTQDENERAQERILDEQVAAQQATGSSARRAFIGTPSMEDGWSLSVNFTANRQRPPAGNALVIEEDDTAICRELGLDPISEQRCIEERQAARVGDPNQDQTTVGGPFRRIPPNATIQSNLALPITQNWAGAWQTTYDFQTQKFASHAVNLTRELHDWNATFSILRAPNGNFSFSFFIALKSQPDLKFEHNRDSYRRTR